MKVEALDGAVKFALAFYGTRGDVELGVAVGRELLRRGHDVRMAVSPDLIEFAESAGLAAVAYGPDSQTAISRDFAATVFKDFPRRGARITDLVRLWREYRQFLAECWVEMTTTLKSLANGADVLVTGMLFEDGAANVAEYYNIPLATLHYSPVRATGQFLPFLSAPLGRLAIKGIWWMARGVFGSYEDAQRRDLGLPEVTGPAQLRITERGALEIQAYDEVCFPGLAAEWAGWDRQRPFVGGLTLALPTESDDEVLDWISAGTPPVCFAFGSMAMNSPTDTLAMVSAACAQLGERALMCSGSSDFGDITHPEHVKVVGMVNYEAVFPACRAVVHHGGSGTTAAALRAGVPTLVLWAAPDRQMWGTRVKKLKVGTSRRFSRTTKKSLVADLRTILAPQYIARAREVATRMTKSNESVETTADLVEGLVRPFRGIGVGGSPD